MACSSCKNLHPLHCYNCLVKENLRLQQEASKMQDLFREILRHEHCSSCCGLKVVDRWFREIKLLFNNLS